jgi:hypothetical protein
MDRIEHFLFTLEYYLTDLKYFHLGMSRNFLPYKYFNYFRDIRKFFCERIEQRYRKPFEPFLVFPESARFLPFVRFCI